MKNPIERSKSAFVVETRDSIESNSNSSDSYLKKQFKGKVAQEILGISDDGDDEPKRTLSLSRISASSKTLNPGDALFPVFLKQKVQLPQRAVQSFNLQEEGKRRQAKLLLASLLENFCQLYDESPQRNHKLFLVICKMLSSTGIIDEEYINELSGVRHSYMSAFKELVSQASQEVEKEKSFKHEKRSYSLQYLPSEDSHSSDSFEHLKSRHSSLRNPVNNLDDLLSLSESRYRTDFEESISVGKGGFGSVWMAKNKLNGICYAIKKIRLKDHFKYERILREIRCLALLDHVNIVRYYSSWLEYVNYSTEAVDPDDSVSGFNTFDTESRASVSSYPVDDSFQTGFDEYSTDSIVFTHHVEGSDSDYSSELPSQDAIKKATTKSSNDSSVYFDAKTEGSGGSKFHIGDTSSERSDSSGSVSDCENRLDSIKALDESSEFEIEFVQDCEDVSQASDLSVVPLRKPFSAGPLKHRNVLPSPPRRQLTLFIQMQLCGSTLKDFLDWRNSGTFIQPRGKNGTQSSTNPNKSSEPIYLAIDPVANIRLFRSIVNGVNCIHDAGLVHRDLKPANIFLSLPQETKMDSTSVSPSDSVSSSELPSGLADGFCPFEKAASHTSFQDFDRFIPKIGDFGLATSFTEPELTHQHGPKRKTSRTSQVGTYTYASPEQLSVPPVSYNEKSDIYSLGIIFFELFHPFSTGMERLEVLKNLRQGVLPKDFVSKWPKEAACILWLTADNPDLRPSAKEILEFELLNPPTSSQLQFQSQLARKDELIHHLQEENRTLTQNVESLQQQVAALQLALQNK